MADVQRANIAGCQDVEDCQKQLIESNTENETILLEMKSMNRSGHS